MILPAWSRLLGSFVRPILRGVLIAAARSALALPLLAPALGVLAPAPQARAQFGMDMGGLLNRDVLTRRGLDGYARILKLDADQRAAADSLLEGGQAAHRAATKKFQQKMEELQTKAREDGDFGAFQTELPAAAEEMQNTLRAVEKQFFDDLRSLCSEAQVADFERVERFRRRETGMIFQGVSGAAVDLVAIVERHKLAEGVTDVEDALREYELAIDKPLKAFHKLQEDQAKAQKEMTEKIQANPANAMEEVTKAIQPLFENAQAIRAVNRDHARKIAPLLREEARAKFEQEINRRSFPRIYRDAHVMKQIGAALKMSDLTADQRRDLEALRDAYRREAAPLSDAWAKATEEYENKNNGTIGVMMTMWMGGGEGKQAMTDARTARRDLDKRTEEKLKGLLNPAQREALPAKKADPQDQFADFLPGAMEDEDEE